MRTIAVFIFLYICSLSFAYSQTLNEAKDLYLKGKFKEALPVMEAEYNAKPTDPSLNQWYGACLFETGGDMQKAEECLKFASTKGIQDSFVYLGRIYTGQYRFEEAEAAFDQYKSLLTKKNPRKKKDEIARDEAALIRLEGYEKVLSRLRRMANNTEDIQIIDSMVVDKEDFLTAYKLSLSGGRIEYFGDVFDTNIPVSSTVYYNEKETKIYYAQPDTSKFYTLFSMEKLLEGFGNEKKLSANNFNLRGNMNYPFMMPDGVTIYFAANDEESIGGYDLFVSRYNMNNDTYLTPERMNMPFNSIYNDYMLVIDEMKGVGWFASDRFQPEDKVCVYTFIPNAKVKIVESEDEVYKTNRALITSIKDSWQDGTDYSKLVAFARKTPVEEKKVVRDFEFVINEQHTYYTLSDFKNKTARDMYFKVVQMKKELAEAEKNLESKRNTYASASQGDKRSLTSSILDLEKKVERMQKEIPALEVQSRNQEIQDIR